MNTTMLMPLVRKTMKMELESTTGNWQDVLRLSHNSSQSGTIKELQGGTYEPGGLSEIV